MDPDMQRTASDAGLRTRLIVINTLNSIHGTNVRHAARSRQDLQRDPGHRISESGAEWVWWWISFLTALMEYTSDLRKEGSISSHIRDTIFLGREGMVAGS